MFDSIIFTCKKEGCGGVIEDQSKSGPCNLETYNKNEVPVEVAAGVLGGMVCCPVCKTKYFVRSKVSTIKLKLVKYAD